MEEEGALQLCQAHNRHQKWCPNPPVNKPGLNELEYIAADGVSTGTGSLMNSMSSPKSTCIFTALCHYLAQSFF